MRKNIREILLPNAYESWIAAIHYAEQLHDGICTLGAKRTIEFKDLISIVNKDLFPGHTFSAPLKELNRLRNEETHFHIKNEDYLTDQEFECFYNFMIDFYHALNTVKLMPWAFGEPHAGMEYSRLTFNRRKLNNFNYKQALKQSDTVQRLREIFKDEPAPFDIVENPYECCDLYYCTNSVDQDQNNYFDHSAALGLSFEDFLEYIYSLIECNLIHVTECKEPSSDFFSASPEIVFIDPEYFNDYGYMVEIES